MTIAELVTHAKMGCSDAYLGPGRGVGNRENDHM
jgi:hypothetical protein